MRRFILLLGAVALGCALGCDGGSGFQAAGPDADVVPPTVTITAPPEGGEDATLAFSVSEWAATIVCSFDGGDYVDCGSGSTGSLAIPAALSGGSHTAAVRATDGAGNVSAAAMRGFVVPARALSLTVAPRSSPCAAEAVAFAASAPGATFSCALDGAAGTACASPFALPADLVTGMHVLTVTAAAGGATAERSIVFAIDASRPFIIVTAVQPVPDQAETFDPAGAIFWHSNKPVTARCALDDGAGVDCSSASLEGSFFYSGLLEAANPHRFTVAVTDACGHEASNTVAMVVDSTPPAPCLVDGAGGCVAAPPTTGGSGALTFAAEPGSYLCNLETAGVETAPGTPGLGFRFACSPGKPINVQGLSDLGEEGRLYQLVVDGVDLHNNRSRTALSFAVDTTGPAVHVHAMSTDQDRGSATATYTIDGGATSFPTCTLDDLPCVCGATSVTCQRVAAGTHRLRVGAADALGNVGPTIDAAPNMVYGPRGGRAILLGFNLHERSADATALLRAAVNDVPWKKSGAFDRPLRVLTFQAGMADADATAHIAEALAGLVEGAGSGRLTDPFPFVLEQALVNKDVLIVEDQHDPATSQAIGELWGDTGPLRRFLDLGGVAVVLDGEGSDTWQILAGGQQPIVGIDASAASDGVWSYAPTASERVFGVPSDLMIGAQARGAVSFHLIDEEQPRATYVDAGGDAGVVEKIFPIYVMSIDVFGAPGTRLVVASSTKAGDVADTQCTAVVERCDDQAGCCPGGDDPHATLCACPPINPALGEFRLPSRRGEYSIEARLMTPHKPGVDPNPRPGRTLAKPYIVP